MGGRRYRNKLMEPPDFDKDFWDYINQLVSVSKIVVDRPRGSAHPRYPSLIYPLDYGHLAETISGDGEGIDIWVGSGGGRYVEAVICTIDLEKRDAEIKLLVGCTPDDTRRIIEVTNVGLMRCVLIRRLDA